MPVASAVNDMWEVKVISHMDEQAIMNVLHFKTIHASADVELDLIKALLTCFVTNLLPVLAARFLMAEVRYKQVSPVLGPEHIYTIPNPNQGMISSDPLPTFCAICISLRTDFGGRSKRGRMYLGGIPEVATATNYIDELDPLWAGVIAFIACVATKFIHPDPVGTTAMFDLGVYSRKLGGKTFPYGAAGFTAVTSLVPHLDIATMRSRRVGHGI